MRRFLCYLLLLSLLQSAIPSLLHPELICAADAGGSGIRHVHVDGTTAGAHHAHQHGHRHGHSHGHGQRDKGTGAESTPCNCLKSSHRHDADAAWLPDLTVDVRRDVDDFSVAESVPRDVVWVLHSVECADACPAADRGSSWHGNLRLCLRI